MLPLLLSQAMVLVQNPEYSVTELLTEKIPAIILVSRHPGVPASRFPGPIPGPTPEKEFSAHDDG